jgi:serine/threonine protein kinase
MLTDFGISRILIESKTFTGTNSLKGNVRWMAAELLDWKLHDSQPEHQFHTKATDVWAFGMVLYVRALLSPSSNMYSFHYIQELIARNVPFFNLTHEPVVMMAIIHGERPTDLNGVQWNEGVELLWGICERCWFINPAERPQISNILEELVRYFR